MSLAGKRKEPEPSSSPFPPEIWSAILERVDARSLASARLVCREWREIATPLVRAARVRECLIEPIVVLRGCGRIILSIVSWAGMFATTDYVGILRLWSASGAPIQISVAADLRACDVYAWGNTLVSTGVLKKEITLWKISRDGPKLRSGRTVGFLERVRTLIPRELVTVLEPWGDKLAVGRVGGDIETWDENGAVLSRMVAHSHRIDTLISMGKRLASVSVDSEVRVWDETGSCVCVSDLFDLGSGGLFGKVVSGVQVWGERLAIANGEGDVHIWSDGGMECGTCETFPRMYVWEGALLTPSGPNTSTARDEFGTRSLQLNLRKFMYYAHGLLATRENERDEVWVWGVPE